MTVVEAGWTVGGLGLHTPSPRDASIFYNITHVPVEIGENGAYSIGLGMQIKLI